MGITIKCPSCGAGIEQIKNEGIFDHKLDTWLAECLICGQVFTISRRDGSIVLGELATYARCSRCGIYGYYPYCPDCSKLITDYALPEWMERGIDDAYSKEVPNEKR